jgi:hypothetical protein
VTLELAVDYHGITHVVAPRRTVRPGELITECGVTARWKDLTLWWSPLVMSRAENPDDVATCMTCLVSVSRWT